MKQGKRNVFNRLVSRARKAIRGSGVEFGKDFGPMQDVYEKQERLEEKE